MFSQSYLFLYLLVIIALIAKNTSLLFAVGALLILKVIGLDAKSFSFIQSKGINWGLPLLQ